MPLPPAYDYKVQTDALAKRQALVDAMQKSALDGSADTGIGSSLGRIVQGYFAQKKAKQLAEDQQAFGDQYNKDLQTGVGAYMEKLQGNDPKGAVMAALASNHPILQQLALQQMQQMGKQDITIKDLAAYVTPESLLAHVKDPSIPLQPKRKLTTLTPGEVAIDEGGAIAQPGVPKGAATPAAEVPTNANSLPTGPGWSTQKVGEDLYQQSATGMKKLDNAPRVNTSISLNPVLKGEGSFMEGLGKDTATMVQEARKRKVAAESNLTTAATLEDLDKKGTFSGPMANFLTVLSAYAQTVSIPVDINKLKNSQGYQAELGRRVAEALMATAGVGRSFTDPDREEYMKQFPQLIASPEGRAQIIQQMREAAKKDLSWYQQVAENVRKNYPDAARLMTISPANVDYPQTPADSQDASKAPRTRTRTRNWHDL